MVSCYIKKKKIDPKTFDIKMDVLINEESIKKRKVLEHACDVCQKTFSKKRNITCHVNSSHLGVKSFACDKCEMNFAHKGNLIRHVSVVHIGVKNFAFHTESRSHKSHEVCASRHKKSYM